MKATVHLTAKTFDGREAFTAGSYVGSNPHEALEQVRAIHRMGGIPWATVRGGPLTPQDINDETLIILSVEEQPEDT